jgi:endonuclease/exonuclease/phosphatase family metal-dependent hydrolase
MFAALILVACGSVEPTTYTTYTTFNAGLAVAFVPAANERAPDVADAVAALESDFVCLQEVWMPEHVAMFEDAAKGTFEHTYFPEAQQGVMADAACPAEEIDPLAACIEDECGDKCDDELVDCLFASCLLDFLSLGSTCSTCVMAHVGIADAAEVQATCSTTGIEYAYGGSFGTGILSKYPISVDETVLTSTTNRRGLLHAVVETPEGDVDAWCTHLTAGLSSIPYNGTYESWEAEQAAQVTELAALLVDAPDPVILLGDLNSGPATDNADAEFLANYDVVSSGFDNPYMDQDGRCTFCPENKLSSVDSDETGRLIDHILIRGFEAELIEVRRDLDGSLATESCGAAMDGNHSDHFGISVSITR